MLEEAVILLVSRELDCRTTWPRSSTGGGSRSSPSSAAGTQHGRWLPLLSRTGHNGAGMHRLPLLQPPGKGIPVGGDPSPQARGGNTTAPAAPPGGPRGQRGPTAASCLSPSVLLLFGRRKGRPVQSARSFIHSKPNSSREHLARSAHLVRRSLSACPSTVVVTSAFECLNGNNLD